MTAVPTPRTPAPSRCARHPSYFLASCQTCQDAHHKPQVVAQR